ncbi:MAG: GIY-YIG nuclease family protein, partial [Nanoarchaeota archaeon]
MDQALLASLPTKPGVYIFKDEKNKAIYVGKARELKKRVSSYFSNKALETRTLRLVSEAKFVDHIVVASEIEAFLLESSLIKKYKPEYNIRLIDDKSFPFLEIAKKPIPYVVLTRKKSNKNASYFGPYTNVTNLKTVLRLLRRIFPYQSVKNHPPKRCLYNHIGLCPCVLAFPEKISEYKKNIRNLISFMKGNKHKVIRNLQKEQNACVKREEFEKAGEIQRKIEKIGYITSETYDPFRYEEQPDYYFERIRTEVSSLKEILIK